MLHGNPSYVLLDTLHVAVCVFLTAQPTAILERHAWQGLNTNPATTFQSRYRQPGRQKKKKESARSGQ